MATQDTTAKPKLKRTLYIGLGGTGFKTLLHTKRAFIETYGEVPPMIKFLAVDSDQNQYKNTSLPSIHGDIKFDPSESSDIMVTNAPQKVLRQRGELTWLPEKNMNAVEDLTNGCGMVRTNGRIAFSFNYQKTRQNIENALNQIQNLQIVQSDKYQLMSQSVEVVIVFSIGGGTGSGTFIDTAYMVKDIFQAQALPQTSKIIGYMVLPDVYNAQLVFGKDRLYPNGCGSLVDLDYLMHLNFTDRIQANYLTTQKYLVGAPFHTIIAISNKNHNGDVVNDCQDIANMLSLALVVSAGELSGGMQSVANNLERDMRTGDFDIKNKRAVMGTLGMSEIVFRSSALSELYTAKAARELAAALLAPGSNLDIKANTWIDENLIRENNGQDQVIDYLLSKDPGTPMSEVNNHANPNDDIERYRTQNNVAVDTNKLNDKVRGLIDRIDKSFDKEISGQVNSKGPNYALEFIAQLREQINICVKEMTDEKSEFVGKSTQYESAVKAAVEDYKNAQNKFFGKKKAVEEAQEVLCAAVRALVVNDREIHRRNGALSFYNWLLSKMSQTEEKMKNIANVISSACGLIRNRIADIDNQLRSERGLFEVDLTQPYIDMVNVTPGDVDVNQFIISLKNKNKEIGQYLNVTNKEVADDIMDYASTLESGERWQNMSVEDALKKLPKEEINDVVAKAIALSSPMGPLNYGGEIEPTLNNYYYIGVEEQSTTGLTGSIIDVDKCIPAGEMHETYYASVGSRDRIVFYHQYGVFPTYAISSAKSYRDAHDEYMKRPTAYSFHIDEDLRKKMEREGFSVRPKEQTDNSLEMWVKGIIFGLITRDEDGKFLYKDETKTEYALDDYWTPLGTEYRDEAYNNFKRECEKLQPQFEKHLVNRAKSEGEESINKIIADAKLSYLEKYSLDTLNKTERNNPLYRGIKDQLIKEVEFVNKELS